MIRSGDFFLDVSIDEVGFQFGTGDEIIDSPADISGTGFGFHVPPGITVRLRMKMTEGVDITLFVDDVVEPGSFDVHEAGIVAVFPGAGQVDFIVGGIDVAAKHCGFGQRLDHFFKAVVEVQFVFDAMSAHAAVGKIAVEEKEFFKFQADQTALGVEEGIVEIRYNLEWFGAGIDGDARVAFALAGLPVTLVAVDMQEIFAELFGVAFGFLQSDDVGMAGFRPMNEAFLFGGAEAVDVPAIK